MTGLFKFLSAAPLWFAHALGGCLGWLAFGFSRQYRQRLLDNARQAGLNRWQALASVGSAGQQIAELPRLWFGKNVPIQWQGEQHIDAALASGQGIVFLTPHLGCFEVTAQAYALRYGQAGKPMTVLYRPPRKAWLMQLITTARRRPGLDTAPTSLAGVKQMIKALKNGESVGLLPDQVPPAGQGVWSPFFGRQAYTMTLSVRLALQTRAIILIAWGERLPWGRGFKINVSPLPTASASATGQTERLAERRQLARDLEGAVRQVNAAMESLIRTAPQQYLWGYARYKTPKVES